jgi:hypothetical protein
MASISVDVDLDDFELDEILDELEDRYNSYYRKEKNQKEINAFIKRMKIDCEEEGSNKNMSIIDNIKVDFLLNNLHKITLNDLEKIVNK